MTQEFHLSITPVGDRDYLVRTECVEPGVPLAEEQVTWPLERWLHQARSLMQDPLLRLFQADDLSDLSELGDLGDLTAPLHFADRDAPLSPELITGDPPDPLGNRSSRSAQDLVSLGKELFRALFCDSLRDSWMMAQAIAQNQQAPLRLRLGIKGEALNCLPWEVLHDIDQPLTAGTDILFSRYRPRSLQGPLPQPLSTGEPLRILMAISTPNNQTKLALTQETHSLLEELQQCRAPIDIMPLEQPSRRSLTQALEQGNYQIFHYAGHSVSGPHGGAVSLVNERSGLAERMSGEDLAGLLANNGISFALFNSCRGAHRQSEGDGAGNLAEAAIDRRIPAVLAMAERIPDEVALLLTRLFYRNLSQGIAIDQSLSRARQGLISSFGSRQLYWALPVFYLHPEFDGHLTITNPPPTPAGQGRRHAPEVADLMGLVETEESEQRRDRASNSPPERYADTTPDNTPNNTGTAPILDPEAIAHDLLPDRLPDDSLLDGLTDAPIAPPTDEAIVHPVTPTPENHTKAANTTPPLPSPRTQLPVKPRTLPAIPTMTLTIAAGLLLVGLSWASWRSRISDPQGDIFTPVAPTTANLEAIVGSASIAIARGDWDTALPAIEQLLDLGALPSARSLLDTVPPEALDRADVQFLLGRWAWQTRVSGKLDASYYDAQRRWTDAVAGQPDNLLYRTALGWAYYAEGNFEEADRVWRDALALLQSNTASVAGSSLTRPTVARSLQAGVALSLAQRDRTDEAITLRDTILATDDALTLQSPQLAQNWLWTAEAIAQWQTLLTHRTAITTPTVPDTP